MLALRSDNRHSFRVALRLRKGQAQPLLAASTVVQEQSGQGQQRAAQAQQAGKATTAGTLASQKAHENHAGNAP
ncbi:hypothetical protein D3C76_1788770 [compost metagenome]